MQDICTIWSRGGIGISECNEKRREAFNIVLSMPPGTDSPSVLEAARAFAQAQFRDHQYHQEPQVIPDCAKFNHEQES